MRTRNVQLTILMLFLAAVSGVLHFWYGVGAFALLAVLGPEDWGG